MEREEILTLLDEQRKYYNDSFDRLQRQLTDAMKDADRKINDVITSLEFTQSRLDESLTSLASVVKERDEAVSKIRHLTEENQDLKTQLDQTNDRLDYLDDQSRRNNLRFSGIPEQPGENWEQCQVRVNHVLQDNLNMQDTAFDRVHRVGKRNSQRPRDIVAKFSSFRDRDTAFRNRSKLKGTNIYINEDLCPSTLEIRRSQMDALREARRNGKHAYFSYRTLVIREPLGGGGGGGVVTRRHDPVRHSPTASSLPHQSPAIPQSSTHRSPPTSPPPSPNHRQPSSSLAPSGGRQTIEGASGIQEPTSEREQQRQPDANSKTPKDSHQTSSVQEKSQRPRKQPDRFSSK